MNKVLTIGLSVLTTAAACTGVVGVLANVPSTKDMFDFKRENQATISNLEEQLSEKDKALTEKDAQLTEKNNQIEGQQTTIEELQTILAGPQPIVIPEDINFSGGVQLINTDTDLAFVSSVSSNGTNGLFKVNKSTGEFTQLTDKNYNYEYARFLKDNKIVFTSNSTTAYVVIYDLDSSDYFVSEETYNLSNFDRCLESENYIILGHSGSSKDCVIFNKETKAFSKYTESIKLGYCCLYGNKLITGLSATELRILDFDTLESEIITTTEQQYPMLTKNGVYLFSSAALSKLDVETKTITKISDGSFTQFTTYEEIADGLYLTTSTGVNHCIVLLNTNLDKALSFGTASYTTNHVVIDSTRVIITKGSSYTYYVDFSTDTQTTLSSIMLTPVVLPNGNVLCSGRSDCGIFDIETNAYTKYSVLNGITITSVEDLGEGMYKLHTDNKETSVVYDSVNATMRIYSLIIE